MATSTNSAIDATAVPETDDVKSVAAALVAAGIGCLAMGIVTTLSEAAKSVANLLNLYKPVGPLSGKALVAVAIWLIAWVLLSRIAKAQPIKVTRWIGAAFVFVALGILSTCPLFFDLFGDK